MTPAELRDSGGFSLVVAPLSGEVLTFKGRGVGDLFDLYMTNPEALRGAEVADKVVGAGAAVLMVLGGVGRVDAPIVSTDALSILCRAGVAVTGYKEVAMIVNRAGTGRCPLETIIASAGTDSSPAELLPLIAGFVEKMRS